MSDSFTWLWKAGVALPVFNITEPKMPLLLNQKAHYLNFFSLMSACSLQSTEVCQTQNHKSEKDINKGAIYENVAAQELIAHGCRCYYYNNKKNKVN